MGRSEGLINGAATIAILLFCLAMTFAAILASEVIQRWLGETGTDVVGRISGDLLAALAVPRHGDQVPYPDFQEEDHPLDC